MENLPNGIKKYMRLAVHELIPFVWLSDGFNFIEARFTKEAVNDYRKRYSHLKFSNLRDKLIYVVKWSLQIKQCDSQKVFTSYKNITVEFVIEEFKPILHVFPNVR